MKKLTEQKQTLDDVCHLISAMEWELKLMRAIIFRYHLMYENLSKNKRIK